MDPIFFKNQASLRAWFEQHHTTETELLVGYYKVDTKRASITWSQSVDEAICFGWIDGIRRSIDQESYCIRFTPRRPGSNWSQVNIKKAEELTKQGLMCKAGLEAFSKRRAVDPPEYSYESDKQVLLHESMEKQFRQNKRAWDYFQAEAPSYRKITIRWVMGAKQENTRLVRLSELIGSCEAGEKIKAMRFGKK
jgi:uncharacterized protein YdeI (YjbR/CyaY-like superfamily)